MYISAVLECLRILPTTNTYMYAHHLCHTDVVVLEAFLCRLGRVDRVQPGFTSLPLLLSRGPQGLSSELQLWLQTSFDCHITPHSLEPEDLSLLLGQFATAEKSK